MRALLARSLPCVLLILTACSPDNRETAAAAPPAAPPRNGSDPTPSGPPHPGPHRRRPGHRGARRGGPTSGAAQDRLRLDPLGPAPPREPPGNPRGPDLPPAPHGEAAGAAHPQGARLLRHR